MAYAYPDGTYVSADWASHKNRTPPSSEPGTDYGCAYGTPILAPAAGLVRYVQTSPSGGTGRYVWLDLDDGRSARALHLSQVDVKAGWRVSKGQRVGLSGASGNGSNYFYGPHLHQTLLPTTTTPLAQSIDFEKYVGTTPAPAPAPPKPKEDEDMFRAKSPSSGNWYVIGEFSVTTIPAGGEGSANQTHAKAYNDMVGVSFPEVSSDRIKLALADVDARITDFLGRLGQTAQAEESSARIQALIAAEG
jgi:murein DD-endopeptidase